jgi:hypothetical protein
MEQQKNKESGCEFTGQLEYDLDELKNGQPVHELSEETYRRVASLKNRLITFWFHDGRYVLACSLIFGLSFLAGYIGGIVLTIIVFFSLLFVAEKWVFKGRS